MKKLFTATQHYVVQALHKGGVTFPTTKKDIIAKAGKFPVRTDWETCVPLADYIKDVKLDKYENKAQFFNAWVGTVTKL